MSIRRRLIQQSNVHPEWEGILQDCLGAVDSDYLGIQKVSRGFLSFTSKGVMRSELIDSINPFRHLPGETKRVPLSAWCLTKISDTDVLMLSRFGLSRSADGVLFEEFQPIQNEYFKQVEIPPLESLMNGVISLYYSVSRDELYVSFAQNQTIGQYTKAWVLYVKRDSWSNFNRGNKGFISIDADDSGPVFQQAFVDDLGKVSYLDDDSNIQSIEAQNTLGSYAEELLVYSTYQIEGVSIMPTNCRMAGFSGVGFPPLAGFYELNGVVETQRTDNRGPVAPVIIPADPSATSNLMKWSEEMDNFPSWLTIGTPVITADTDLAPDGTTTMDTVEDDDASLSEAVDGSYASLNSARPYWVSVYNQTCGDYELEIEFVNCALVSVEEKQWSHVKQLYR